MAVRSRMAKKSRTRKATKSKSTGATVLVIKLNSEVAKKLGLSSGRKSKTTRPKKRVTAYRTKKSTRSKSWFDS